MKSRLKRIAMLTTMSVLFVGAPVFAQADATMTDAHIARIKANCQQARTTLSQIHANDAPDYINRNQTYYSISDKLMARLNSRLTLNRYDATDLVKTASDFNAELVQFRTLYQAYDGAMSTALGVDCSKEPVSFYDAVANARTARQSVHDSADKLTSFINQYRQEVQTLETQHLSSTATQGVNRT